jgi:hypothetical protein
VSGKTMATAGAQERASLMDSGMAGHLPTQYREIAPVSNHLFESLRALRCLWPGDRDYEVAFDEFEAFFTSVVADLEKKEDVESPSLWAPAGRFVRMFTNDRTGSRAPFARIAHEASSEDKSWGAFRAGFFQGSPSRFNRLLERIKQEQFPEWNQAAARRPFNG